MTVVFIVGLPRSGTTFLGRKLSVFENVIYLEEPNPIWRYKNWRKLGHEEFSPGDVTDYVRAYIRKSILQKYQPGKVLVEKTPANCIRVDFVKEIFPEAKIIFIKRDREEIVTSMLSKWLNGDDRNAEHLGERRFGRDFFGRLRKIRFVHWTELPAYIFADIRDKFSRLIRGHAVFWGPQFNGWENLIDERPEETVSKSCKYMEQKLDKFISESSDSFCIVDFKDLKANSDRVVDVIEKDFALRFEHCSKVPLPKSREGDTRCA